MVCACPDALMRRTDLQSQAERRLMCWHKSLQLHHNLDCHLLPTSSLHILTKLPLAVHGLTHCMHLVHDVVTHIWSHSILLQAIRILKSHMYLVFRSCGNPCMDLHAVLTHMPLCSSAAAIE